MRMLPVATLYNMQIQNFLKGFTWYNMFYTEWSSLNATPCSRCIELDSTTIASRVCISYEIILPRMCTSDYLVEQANSVKLKFYSKKGFYIIIFYLYNSYEHEQIKSENRSMVLIFFCHHQPTRKKWFRHFQQCHYLKKCPSKTTL